MGKHADEVERLMKHATLRTDTGLEILTTGKDPDPVTVEHRIDVLYGAVQGLRDAILYVAGLLDG